MEPGTITRVLQDVFTIHEGELSLNRNDIFQVTRSVDKYWCYGNSCHKIGLFPADKLIPVEVPNLTEHQELFLAQADFSGEQEGDLRFWKGEFIIGEQKLDEHWWLGKISESRKGVFPDTFTWQLDSTALKGKKKSQALNLKAQVKISLQAQLDEEMDLKVGEIVTITEETDTGWYRGTCGNRSGIFPAAYVTLLDSLPANIQETNTHSNEENVGGGNSVNSSHSINLHSNLRNNGILDSPMDLMTFSPEKERQHLPGSKTAPELDILNDDYFKINMPSLHSSSASIMNTSSSSGTCSSIPSFISELVNELDNFNVQPYGMTLYPFYAQYSNELSFHENEIVHLIRYIDDDWLEGEIDGRKGIFPVSYINILVDCDKMSAVGAQSSADEQSVALSARSLAKVMYSFDGQMSGDLSVKEGEIVMIMKIVDKDWCEIRNTAGDVGLCPSNHLSSHELAASATLFRSSSFSSDHSSLDSTQSSRRTFEAHDFTLFGKEDGSKVEDLISKNLSILNNANTTKRRSPIDKLFIDYKEEIISKHSVLAENDDKLECQSQPPNYPPPPVPSGIISAVCSERSPGLLEEEHTERSPILSLPPLPPPPEVQHCVTGASNECAVRRMAPPIPAAPPRPPPPLRQISIDKEPHRPAPPVPIAGQTPVRRSLKRLPRQTSAPVFFTNEPEDVHSIKELLKQKEKRLEHLQLVHEDIETELQQTSENDGNYNELKHQKELNGKKMQRIKSDIQHFKKKVDIIESGASTGLRDNPPVQKIDEAKSIKMSEQRQNVISELVMTEKEYVRDLKLTYEVFNLHSPLMLEERGIDVKALFGNILEVMHTAEDFLDSLQLAMKGQSDEDQCVGPVFLKHSDQIKKAYSKYCANHEHALSLLERYKVLPAAQAIFDKAMETLRYQVACFNIGSVLIKPVQRLLKYPLILNELLKCTQDNHRDKPDLLKAVQVYIAMASDINEYKRQKDIVSKYLGDGTSTLARKMAKLNLHSVAKKSSRISAKLSSSLGLSMAPKDECFLEQERTFHALERTLRTYLRNLDVLMNHLSDEVTCLFHVGELLATFYMERCSDQDVDEFRTTQRLIVSQYWDEFKNLVKRRVTEPLNALLELFQGPSKLVEKRNDKLLDYDNCLAKAEKNKDNRQIQDELLTSKKNYEALNKQLTEDLPRLIQLSSDILLDCLSAFVLGRKLLSGKITKQYLNLMEIPSLASSAGDAVETFSVKHYLVCNQLGRFSFTSKGFRESGGNRKSLRTSPTSSRQLGTGGHKLEQSASQCAYLQSKFSPDKLFRTIEEHVAGDPLDLSLSKGHVVGVLKKQDPMGNPSRWFVDNGVAQGFVRCSCLEPVTSSVPSSPGSLNTSTSSCTTPSPNRLRPNSASSSRTSGSGYSPRQSISPKTSPHLQKSSEIDNLPPSYEEVTRISPGQHRYDEVPSDSTDNLGNIYEEIKTRGEVQNQIYDEVPEQACSSDLSADPEFYYARYEFSGMDPNTLPLKVGQVINVLKREDEQGNGEWWLVEDRFGKRGYVPANYLLVYSTDASLNVV